MSGYIWAMHEPMRRIIKGKPKPIEFAGIHLPLYARCGCFPHLLLLHHIGYELMDSGKRKGIMIRYRLCQN